MNHVARDLTDAEDAARVTPSHVVAHTLPTGLTPDEGPTHLLVGYRRGVTIVEPAGESYNGDAWAYDAVLTPTEVLHDFVLLRLG